MTHNMITTPNYIMTHKYIMISNYTPPQTEAYTSYMPSLSQILESET